jgi:hypothetical protein
MAVALASGTLVVVPTASATTAGGHLWVSNQFGSGVLTGPMAAGSTPSIQTPVSGAAYQIVFQGANGDLFTAGPTTPATDLGVAMADNTSPSLVETTASGAWEAYYQSPTGFLAAAGGFGDFVSTRWKLAPNTNPSVVGTSFGADDFQLAWQGSNGNLWVDGPLGPNGATEVLDTGLAMMAGTSPSVTELGGVHAEIAFEGANSDLWIYGSNNPGDTHKTVARGTNPAIIAFSTGFLIAYHGTDGNLITYTEPGQAQIPTGAHEWFWPMVPGTSPSLVDAGPLALITFQMADTAIAPFGQVITFLPFNDAGQEQLINDGAAAATNTSTSIAELRNGGYATAFQAAT